MHIFDIRDRLPSFSLQVQEVLELIIEAVNDYPEFNLGDVELYLERIKALAKQDKLTTAVISDLCDKLSKSPIDDIWVLTSVAELLDAYKLMDAYGMSIEEILTTINTP